MNAHDVDDTHEARIARKEGSNLAQAIAGCVHDITPVAAEILYLLDVIQHDGRLRKASCSNGAYKDDWKGFEAQNSRLRI